MVGCQGDDGDAPGSQILLISQIEIRRKQHVEPGALGSRQQIAVAQFAPAALVGKRDSVTSTLSHSK
jgi:hypothetical protein